MILCIYDVILQIDDIRAIDRFREPPPFGPMWYDCDGDDYSRIVMSCGVIHWKISVN